MIERRKVRIQGEFLVQFHEYFFCEEFQILKTTFLKLIMDSIFNV